MTSPSPVVGEWYRRPGGALFEVVAIDRDDATVEVQHFDGTLEEFDLESWAEQEFEEAQAPEDWTGSVDVEPEDYEARRSERQHAVDRSAHEPRPLGGVRLLGVAGAAGFVEHFRPLVAAVPIRSVDAIPSASSSRTE